MTVKNNYDMTLERAEKEFIRHDQNTMIEKCGLESDADFLYITFFHRPYRIQRHSGHVECLLENGAVVNAGFDEAMTIFDILCAMKPRRYLGEVWVGLEKFSKTTFDGGTLFRTYAETFDGKTARLKQACEKYGGHPANVSGDVAYCLPLFEFFPVILRFWDGDEEMLPTLRFLWDANTLDYMHFETMFYAMNHILETLDNEIGEEDKIDEIDEFIRKK